MKNKGARHCHSAWCPRATSLNYAVGENRLPVSHSFCTYLLFLFMNANSAEIFSVAEAVAFVVQKGQTKVRQLLIQKTIIG